MLLELILTFNFIIISIGVIDGDRKKVNFAGFPIGMAVACGIFAAVSIIKSLYIRTRYKNFIVKQLGMVMQTKTSRSIPAMSFTHANHTMTTNQHVIN